MIYSIYYVKYPVSYLTGLMLPILTIRIMVKIGCYKKKGCCKHISYYD